MRTLLFESLVVTSPRGRVGQRSATLLLSAGLHSLFGFTVAVVPLLMATSLPSLEPPKVDIFAAPLAIAPPPPPPAPSKGLGGTKTPRTSKVQSAAFVAPTGPLLQLAALPEDPFGIGEGDPNGVPGGIPGGSSLGTMIVGLPDAPPPPPRLVRISQRSAPELRRKVAPVYPELAIAAGVSAVVTLEAEVDAQGKVRAVTVVRGHPLFDQAAVDAVRQWQYRPLLLTGEPTAFILTVTVDFRLERR